MQEAYRFFFPFTYPFWKGYFAWEETVDKA